MSPLNKKIGVFLFLSIWLVISGAYLGGIFDDTYIFCRYADNLIKGNGLVYNLNERVEGVTSLGHTLVVAGWQLIGIDGPRAAVISSFLSGIFSLFLFMFVGSGNSNINILRAVILCACWPFVIWSSSGMDACLFVAGIILSLTAAERYLSKNLPFGLFGWLVAGSMFLLRPEGILVYISFLFISRRELRERRRETIIGCLAGLGPIVLISIFRLYYFDSLLPNTFFAKADGFSFLLILRGLKYILNSSLGLFPLFVVGIWGMIRHRREKFGQLCFSLFLLFLFGIMGVGGDSFPMFRFFLPLVIVLVIFSGFLLSTLEIKSIKPAVFIVSFVIILLGWTVNPVNVFTKKYELENIKFARTQAKTWDMIGKELKLQFGPDQSIALTPIGAIGYRTQWRVFDLVGLVDRHTARLDVKLGKGVQAHEKFDVGYVLNKKPDFILLHTMLWPRVPPMDLLPRRLSMMAEQKMVRHPLFIKNYESLPVPVSKHFLMIYKKRQE